MKLIKWQEREVQGASSTFTGKEKVPSWDGPITPGLHVDARYNNLDVHLRIKEEIKTNIFSATVMYFEPVRNAPPTDLSQDDEVEIHRDYIQWLYNP